MAAKKGTASHSGLLEPFLAPKLTAMLRARDRLALFQTCEKLALRVVATAPTVTLTLSNRGRAGNVDTRRTIITQLLIERATFKLVVEPRDLQPFPAILSSQVTELWLQYDDEGPPSPWLEWNMFENVQSLKLSGVINDDEIDDLSYALEAQLMPELQEFIGGQLAVMSTWQPNIIVCRTVARLGRALAPRVQCYQAESNLWTPFVWYLTSLQTITLSRNASYEVDKLLHHPTLHTVRLENYQAVLGDIQNCACRWRSLHLFGGVHLDALVQLPLAAVQEVQIYDGFDTAGSLTGLTALKYVVDNHLGKVKLIPSWDNHTSRLCCMLGNLTAGTAPIIRALKDDCCLFVALSKTCEEAEAAFVPAVWAALHPLVSSVRLSNLTGVDWPRFWCGIPTTVRHIELASPDFGRVYPSCTIDKPDGATQAMFDLVANAPEHVQTLKLINISPYLQMRWNEAGRAPAHLKCSVKHSSWF